MVEVLSRRLKFSFPEVHRAAWLSVDFQRTIRIPDDGRDYFLPPGLGSFPLEHMADHANRVPEAWRERGGVMIPLHDNEALWMNFETGNVAARQTNYPLVMKVAAGKINAVSGKAWSVPLKRRPRQDYLVAPEQPWLDGFCVEKNVIRQFVAARLGEGITAEEQLTGQAEWGGVQLLVAPMARPAFERHFPMERANRPQMMEAMVSYCQAEAVGDMGLGLGGRMHQEIAKDPYDLADWDQEAASRCFVHLVRAEDWKTLTGKEAPRLPMDVADYLGNKGPWYLHPGTGKPVGGSKKLAGLKTVESFF